MLPLVLLLADWVLLSELPEETLMLVLPPAACVLAGVVITLEPGSVPAGHRTSEGSMSHCHVESSVFGMVMESVVPLMSPVFPPASIHVPCIWRLMKTPGSTLLRLETVPDSVPVIVTDIPAALVPLQLKVATMVSPFLGMTFAPLPVEFEFSGVDPDDDRKVPMRPLYVPPLLSVIVRFCPCCSTMSA